MPSTTQPRPDFQAKASEIVAGQIAHNAAVQPRGVCWSGLTTSRHVEVQDVDAVAARLEREFDERLAWELTPDGRFTTAARLIYEATGDDTLLSCRNRGLDTNHHFAAKLLGEMEGPAADQARAALADYVAALQLVAA
jgi:hypothetical protein